MSVAAGFPVRIRAFLEGIEIPVISADVGTAPNSPAQCTLQVPPAALGLYLLPRTVVHVFYFDAVEAATPLITYRGSDDQNPKPGNPTLYELAKQGKADHKEIPGDPDFARDTRNVHWKLLFAGEIVGMQWVKSPMNRSLVLQCVDMSNYWDTAYQFNNTDLFGPSAKALFSGGSTNLLTDFLSSPGEIIAGLLHLPSANYPALKGFLGGLIRMMESIGGSYFSDNKFEGQNLFFSLAELRLHITQMITAYDQDRTVQKLLGVSYDGLFGRTLGNLGDQVSIRTVLTALTGVIFHETYAITTPAFFPGSNSDTLGRKRQTLVSIPKYRNLYLAAYQGQKLCSEIRNIVQPGDVGGPSENITPAEAKLMALRFRKFANNLTRLRGLASQDRTLSKQNPDILRNIQEAATYLTKASKLVELLKGIWGSRSQKRDELLLTLNKAEVLLKKLEKSEVDISDPKTRLPSRLASQIVRPDVWFAAPPRCNVLFPEQYTQLQYAFNWMQQPTRLLLKLHDEFFGEDQLFDNHLFAPSARTQKGKKSTLQELFGRDVMQHELFTGILPVFTKMGELNVFALRTGKVNGVMPKISLAQRSANYLYFKQKFAPRQMQVNCYFNPHLVGGFPGVIFDTHVNAEDAERYRKMQEAKGKDPTEITKLLGAHYLGNFATINHSISLQQATTSVTVQYPRLYDESSEFFGPSIKEDQEVLERFGQDGLRATRVAALQAPRIGNLGPQYGVISRVDDITAERSAAPGRLADTLPIYTGPRRKGDPSLDGEAKIGTPVRLGDVSPKLAIDQGVNKVVTFKAFVVWEKVPNYRKNTVDLPAEEYMKPGWYDDCWSSSRIGAIYQQYFKTGAITDMTQIGDPDGVPVGTPKQRARDQLAINATDSQESDARRGISPAVLTLDQDASIEQAVRFLLLTYSYMKQGGLSIDKFIQAYTHREVATLPDIFGTSDLQLDARGLKAEKGLEGFHSRAFGPYDDLFGLVTPEITEILGIKKADKARELGDVRGRRHQAVLDYVGALVQGVSRG